MHQLIFHHCGNVKKLLQELARAHLHFNGIFLFKFSEKELLIILILTLITLPTFFISLRKNCASEKSVPTPKVWAITLV